MHGAGAGYLPQLLEGGRTAVTELRGERNPAFPGMQQPEPVAHNLTPLSEWITSNGADIGIALDGDADRVGLVDERRAGSSPLCRRSPYWLCTFWNSGRRGGRW